MNDSNYEVKTSVDVVMPILEYNRFVEQAIKSLNSSKVIIKLLIISHQEITQDLQALNKNIIIKVLKNPEKKYGKAIQVVIPHLTSEYVGFLDGDDIYVQGKLEEQIVRLRNSQADICVTKLSKFENDYEFSSIKPLLPFAKLLKQKGSFLISATGADSSKLMKSSKFKELQNDCGEINTYDWWWALKNIDELKYTYINYPYYLYRQHPNQTTKSKAYRESTTAELEAVWSEVNQKLRLPKLDYFEYSFVLGLTSQDKNWNQISVISWLFQYLGVIKPIRDKALAYCYFSKRFPLAIKNQKFLLASLLFPGFLMFLLNYFLGTIRK
jgi:glycosyltransferase involved in cell wall biosynthesis